jgi:hypothetical protein
MLLAMRESTSLTSVAGLKYQVTSAGPAQACMARWAARPKSEPPDDATSTGGFSLGPGLSGMSLGSLSTHGDDSTDPTASDPDVEPSSGKCDYCGRGRRCLNPLAHHQQYAEVSLKSAASQGGTGAEGPHWGEPAAKVPPICQAPWCGVQPLPQFDLRWLQRDAEVQDQDIHAEGRLCQKV